MSPMGTTAGGPTQAQTAAPEKLAGVREWAWMLRVLALVTVFGAVAIARSRQVDIPFRDPHGKLFSDKIVSTAEALVVAVLVDIVVRGYVGRRQGRSLRRTVMERWTPYRIVMVPAALLAYQVVYLSYRNLKSWDVLRPPQDDMLLRSDKWLFLGHSPAELLHDLLGQDLAARLLSVLYESFSTLVTLALVAALAFAPTVRSAYVFVVSAMWASIQETQETYVAQRAHLLAHPQAHDAFAQISAFASLHCALACLIFLMARYYGLRRLSWAAACYLLATLVATVYLGWHFAVDDVAGIAIAWVAVQLGKLTVLGSSSLPREPTTTP